jgi:p-aminobenzoyl-glutamate transporter AbgT
MTTDTKDRLPDTESLLTLSRVATWVVIVLGLTAITASLVSAFLGASANMNLLFFGTTCVLLTLCFTVLNKVVQALQWLEKKVEENTPNEQKDT